MTGGAGRLVVRAVEPGDEWFAAVRARLGYPTPDEPVAAGAACRIAVRGGEPVARLSLQHVEALVGVDGPAGVIGHYEALDAEAGTRVLREAAAQLFAAGARRVLGPLNGSTWRRYRLVVTSGAPADAAPPFLGEPLNPPDYVEHFRAAGFREVAWYESRLARLAARPQDPPAGSGGVVTRALRPGDWDRELAALHDISLAAFARNAYYSAIAYPAFRAMYTPFRDRLDPALVRLALRGDAVVGFVFAYPDPFDAARPDAPRVVLKTLAVHPAARGLGIGARLTAEVHAAAAARGAREVIHALMHVSNRSVGISGRHDSELFRRYALFGADATGARADGR